VQRELYGFIVEYHKVLLSLLRPGVLPERVLEEAAAVMLPVVERTAWSKPVYEAAARRTLTFKGHLSHPVGMAVHDVGRYWDEPMQPGLVFAL
ncbi:M24 family metallopeptidase, partial [Streptococcus suis]